ASRAGVADFSNGVQDMLDGCNDSSVLTTIDATDGYSRQAVALGRRPRLESERASEARRDEIDRTNRAKTVFNFTRIRGNCEVRWSAASEVLLDVARCSAVAPAELAPVRPQPRGLAAQRADARSCSILTLHKGQHHESLYPLLFLGGPRRHVGRWRISRQRPATADRGLQESGPVGHAGEDV